MKRLVNQFDNERTRITASTPTCGCCSCCCCCLASTVNSSVFTALNFRSLSKQIEEEKKVRVARIAGGILAFPLAVGLFVVLHKIIDVSFYLSISIGWVVYGGLLYLLVPVKSKRMLIIMLLLWVLVPLMTAGELVGLYKIIWHSTTLFWLFLALPAAILFYPMIMLYRRIQYRN